MCTIAVADIGHTPPIQRDLALTHMLDKVVFIEKVHHNSVSHSGGGEDEMVLIFLKVVFIERFCCSNASCCEGGEDEVV